jgi:hypothetical protein
MDGHWVHIIPSRDGWFMNNAVKEKNCYSCMVKLYWRFFFTIHHGINSIDWRDFRVFFCFSLGCGHSRDQVDIFMITILTLVCHALSSPLLEQATIDVSSLKNERILIKKVSIIHHHLKLGTLSKPCNPPCPHECLFSQFCEVAWVIIIYNML